MKNPFKVGDNVKILPRDDSQKYSPPYVDDMLKYAGQLTTITYVDEEFCLIDLDHSSWYWSPNALQSVALETNQTVDPHNLKNGDYIKLTNALCKSSSFIYIFREIKDNMIYRHASYSLSNKYINIRSTRNWLFTDMTEITYATVEEKKLIDEALLKQGCRWNSLTKRLESIHPIDFSVQPVDFSSFQNSVQKAIDITNLLRCIKKETQTETELDLFPKKKHYQLNFNY